MSKFGELIQAEVPVLIHFFAQWNESCKAMRPVIDEVALAMGDQIRVVKIDVEKNQELVDALRIKQVPTLMLYKNGAMIWRQTGVMDAHSLINVTKTL